MRNTASGLLRWPALMVVLALTQGAGAAGGAPQKAREPHRPIPLSLLLEHAALDAELKAVAREPGLVGVAARSVLDVVEPHMRREQELVLPPLRLLPRLASGDISRDMADFIALNDRLRAEQPALLQEHLAIRRALEELWSTAWAEGKPQHAFLAERVNRHIRIDEEVLYPMSLVIGDYLRLALERKAQTD
jgi:hypothetical protein